MKKICVTGANGFIGKNICKALILNGKSIRGFVRKIDPNMNSSEIDYILVGDISSKINWKNHLIGFDCIIHCAGKADALNKKNELNLYRSINTEGTRNLAEQAAQAGVKRLIFLSSIKVYGERLDKNNKKKVFTSFDTPYPNDSYSVSKLEAEKVLWEISSRTKLEVVVIRLPLVYGPGAKGNIMRLIKLINCGIPLPLSTVKNQRSLIGIDNLSNLLIRCIEHPDAKGKTFLVSDNEDLSTPTLLRHIGFAINNPARLFPFPIFLLRFFSLIFGKKKEVSRLLDNCQVDSSYVCDTLKWIPPTSVKEGIKRMVQKYDSDF